jgi:hypothetical protein
VSVDRRALHVLALPRSEDLAQRNGWRFASNAIRRNRRGAVNPAELVDSLVDVNCAKLPACPDLAQA